MSKLNRAKDLLLSFIVAYDDCDYEDDRLTHLSTVTQEFIAELDEDAPEPPSKPNPVTEIDAAHVIHNPIQSHPNIFLSMSHPELNQDADLLKALVDWFDPGETVYVEYGSPGYKPISSDGRRLRIGDRYAKAKQINAHNPRDIPYTRLVIDRPQEHQ